jgi:hypothetical protein
VPLFCGGSPDAGVVFDAGSPGDGTIFQVDAGLFMDGGPGPGPDGGWWPWDAGFDGGGSGRAFMDESEPNHPPASPNDLPIPPNDTLTVRAQLDVGDQDFFTFDVPPGHLGHLHSITHSDPLALGICDPPTDTVLTLFNGMLNAIAGNDDANGSFCSDLGWSWNPAVSNLPEGQYILRVSSFAPLSSAMPYYLTVQVDYQPIGSRWDAGPFFGDGGWFDGGVFDGGPFIPDAGLWPDARPRMDSGGVFPGPDAGLSPGDGGAGWDAFIPDAGGPAADGGVPGPISEVEPNNDRATANPMPYQIVNRVAASLSPAGDHDYFRVDIAPGDTLSLHAQTYTNPSNMTCTPPVDTVLDLLDANGNVLATNDDAVSMIGCSRIDPGTHPGAANLPAGTYYVRARHFATNGTGSYYVDIVLTF